MSNIAADRRRLASNGVYAAAELQGHIEAKYFVKGKFHRISVPVADLRLDPEREKLDRQLLYGDRFRVLHTDGQYAFGQAERGDYVGYVESANLKEWKAPNCKVDQKASVAFTSPDIKTPNPIRLPLGATLHVATHDERFAKTDLGLYVPTSHLVPLNRFASDPVEVAAWFLGTPYLWGGNSDLGLDCSGLVQAACLACGIDCPGDSDQQEAELGMPIAQDAPPKRGDLLFWKGHVAWVVDAETILHANAYHMAVAYEPIGDATQRIQAQGDGPVTSRKRLEFPS
ncbi:MAG: NlpC/P60 family protein [Pseudomonadota bacterium]